MKEHISRSTLVVCTPPKYPLMKQSPIRCPLSITTDIDDCAVCCYKRNCDADVAEEYREYMLYQQKISEE